jgi:hypothetical protein
LTAFGQSPGDFDFMMFQHQRAQGNS